MSNNELTLSKYLTAKCGAECPDKEVQVMQVIRTTLARRGDGKKHPIRAVTQFWSLDGELLGEVDPMARTPEHIETHGV